MNHIRVELDGGRHVWWGAGMPFPLAATEVMVLEGDAEDADTLERFWLAAMQNFRVVERYDFVTNPARVVYAVRTEP